MASTTVAKTLYKLSRNRVYTDLTLATNAHNFLPDHVLFDVFYKIMFTKKQHLLNDNLRSTALDFKVFIRLLKVNYRRQDLHRIFQRAYENGFEKDSNIITNIMTQFRSANTSVCISSIDLGLDIAIFSTEGGWYTLAHSILSHVETLCLQLEDEQQSLLKLLECFRRRIYVESSFYMFEEAQMTYTKAVRTVERLTELGATPNLAALYANFAHLHIMRSEYDEASKWTNLAMTLLNDSLPKKIIVDVLRHASKACVLNGRFERARLLIGQALIHAKEMMLQGDILHYCDTMADHGFCCMHYDDVEKSMDIYEEVKDRRSNYFFSITNFLVCLTYGDLSYCSYVCGYNNKAREYTHFALVMLNRFIPKHHLVLMPAQRVQALMLEELAVDMRDLYHPRKIKDQLKRSVKVHKNTLIASLRVFGTNNVRVAKHYDDLGRVYQSMKKYRRAEKMYLRAIKVKERLLGEGHYEVGMSVSRLASLYSSHLDRYADARDLYLRSIKIKSCVFGDKYSDLGCDYRGLIKVFTELEDETNRLHYMAELHEWHVRRRVRVKPNESPALMDVIAVVDKFFLL